LSFPQGAQFGIDSPREVVWVKYTEKSDISVILGTFAKKTTSRSLTTPLLRKSKETGEEGLCCNHQGGSAQAFTPATRERVEQNATCITAKVTESSLGCKGKMAVSAIMAEERRLLNGERRPFVVQWFNDVEAFLLPRPAAIARRRC
jgi:hypothetical protein